MTYPYASENRLEMPVHYQYAAVGDVSYLTEYFESRLEILSGLKQAPFADLAEWRKTMVRQIEAALVGCLPAGTNPGEFWEARLAEFKTSALLDSEAVLLGLAAWALTHYKDTTELGEGERWLSLLIQRFEVTKKIFTTYQPGLRKGCGDFDALELYSRLALILGHRYGQTANFKYLSTWMKVNDILCSLPGSKLSKAVSEQLGLSIKMEVVSVRALAAEKGVIVGS